MPETPIVWKQLVPGKAYRIQFSGSDSVGTFRKVLWGNPRMAEVLFDVRSPWAGPKATMPMRLTLHTDGTGVQVYPTFGEKLALVNTKLGADPGVLSQIMKFNKSNFKPGPWTGMTKAQSAVSAAKARKEAAAQEEEALAAMKTGGKTRRRRRRRSTRRR
jgi:hypothetical protein